MGVSVPVAVGGPDCVAAAEPVAVWVDVIVSVGVPVVVAVTGGV